MISIWNLSRRPLILTFDFLLPNPKTLDHNSIPTQPPTNFILSSIGQNVCPKLAMYTSRCQISNLSLTRLRAWEKLARLGVWGLKSEI